ncbi:hypothetical protein HBI30_027830 [Parastagonospora nodorum]|nr:hypothetical protein HBI76_177260 [Parastagonospora nodorum]KAH5094818.1 hypothetical protein HBH72_161340 [Parastagonospora nodorum]KAH5460329.1 hypothetical protein HBI30_027830 [Parastagonospora nodorum]
MAATFRSRAPNATQQQQQQQVAVYNGIAVPNAKYASFPIALHHDDSGYDAADYESQGQGTQQLQSGAASEQFDMTPPQASTHASWQALHDYAQSHASEHGYALSINTTAKNRSRIKLACVCYGQPKNTHKLTAETRIRKNRVSYKTGCKMWVEGKKQEDGTWLLRVGEPRHNHAGRPSEGWALQRKRTWGVVGGRIGVGGVTAKEELAKMHAGPADKDDDEGEEAQGASQKPSHSLERGGLVWKIVEQEMLRKSEPSQGRDRGVGRTVDVLHARLPGIHIFKRDVYNIRAQIKRARKAAGQQLGDGVNTEDDDAEEAQEAEAREDTQEDSEHVSPKPPILPRPSHQVRTAPQQPVHSCDFAFDPSLPRTASSLNSSTPSYHVLSSSHAELEQLRKENAQLKGMLTEKTKEVKEKNIVIAGLRSQLDYMTSMAMLPS